MKKLHKLRKVDKGGKLLRLTFKKFFGGTFDRDIILSALKDHWEYLDNGELVSPHNQAIAAFLVMGVECYTVNVGTLMVDNMNILGPPMARPKADPRPLMWDKIRMTKEQLKDSEL